MSFQLTPAPLTIPRILSLLSSTYCIKSRGLPLSGCCRGLALEYEPSHTEVKVNNLFENFETEKYCKILCRGADVSLQM